MTSEPNTILHVEDNPLARRMVRKVLATAGYVVVDAESGEEALALLETVEPVLVLLDIGLPGMDGLEVAARLRADARFQETPIMVVTAWAAPTDQARFRAAGCDEVLVKPISPRTLLESVATILAPQPLP